LNNFLYRAAALALIAGLVTACGGGSTSTPTSTSTPKFDNVIGVTVDAGPADTGYNVNRLYASVKICVPGSSTQCQTIDHVLVDTGSNGLRLLASVLSPALKLGRLTGAGGFPLLNCTQFVDSTFAWGPVASADIVLGDKTAAGVPIQIIADPAFSSPAAACAVGGTAYTTSALLGANGILGLGSYKEDCGAACAATTHNGSYYTCTNASCTETIGAKATIAQQLKNPVPLFATDNNGVLIDLPAVSLTGAASLSGSLIFGVGTKANNQTNTAVALSANSLGYVTTVFGGQSLINSFFDTGSNGLFFDSAAIPGCPASSGAGFYCPGSLTTLSATLVGANAARIAVSFSIDNATALFAGANNIVLPTLSGPMSDVSSFDWGLPFFYGRRVFIGIDGQSSVLGTGPYYAF
jgi:hypothetical protein